MRRALFLFAHAAGDRRQTPIVCPTAKEHTVGRAIGLCGPSVAEIFSKNAAAPFHPALVADFRPSKQATETDPRLPYSISAPRGRPPSASPNSFRYGLPCASYAPGWLRSGFR